MRSTEAITETLAAFTAGLTLAQVPAAVVERTQLLVLDCIGNIVRAGAEAESTPALLSAVAALGLDHGSARVFGDSARYGPAGAVLVNATLAHSLDFDDTHAQSIVHAAAPIIPAALAAAEVSGASGADVVAGIIAGYEVAIRIALALPAGDHYDRGFHPSATCGAFGAVAATARVLGLDAETTASAFGIVLSQTSGSLQFLANGAWTKRFQVGWASMAGFSAATLAGKGFKGASAPLEGKHGFLNAYAPAADPARAVEGLGQTWEVMRTGLKPYPSCRWGHACVDAAIALRREHGLVLADLQSATLGVSQAAMLLIGAPREKKVAPANIVDAQFSGPFVIAVALATGAMGWDSYALLDDPAIRSAMQRIACVNDPEAQAAFPEAMAGRLTLETTKGTFSRFIRTPKGEPDNFLSEAEVLAKFTDLSAPKLGTAEAQALADRVLSLAELPRGAAVFG